MICIEDLELIKEIIDEELRDLMPRACGMNPDNFNYEKYKKMTTLCLTINNDFSYYFYRKPIKIVHEEEDIYNCYSPIIRKFFLEDIILKIKLEKDIEVNAVNKKGERL